MHIKANNWLQQYLDHHTLLTLRRVLQKYMLWMIDNIFIVINLCNVTLEEFLNSRTFDKHFAYKLHCDETSKLISQERR